jgi:hypothetical protein
MPNRSNNINLTINQLGFRTSNLAIGRISAKAVHIPVQHSSILAHSASFFHSKTAFCKPLQNASPAKSFKMIIFSAGPQPLQHRAIGGIIASKGGLAGPLTLRLMTIAEVGSLT